MLHVYSMGAYVASINNRELWQVKAEHGDVSRLWMLLHKSGRVDRFATIKEAREEAQKIGPRVTFSRN